MALSGALTIEDRRKLSEALAERPEEGRLQSVLGGGGGSYGLWKCLIQRAAVPPGGE